MSWVAISRTNHKDKALNRVADFSFSSTVSLVPICYGELSKAAVSLPLVFSRGAKEKIEFCGVMGLQKGNNLFVRADGTWVSSFMPVAIQTWPFKAVDLDNGEQTIIFNENSESIVDREHGDPFFNEDGSEGEVFKKIVASAVAFKQSRALTDEACTMIDDFGLLKSADMFFEKNDGSMFNVNGFLVVNRPEFDKLDAAKFLQLRETCALDLIFANICSLSLFPSLLKAMELKKNHDGTLKNLGQEIFQNKEPEIDFDFS